MNFVLAAGGTGGHMVPAHALAAELRRRGHGVLLITDDRGARFPGLFQGVPVHVLPAGRLRRSPLGLVRGIRSLLAGRREAKNLYKNHRPDAVVGFGGYPAVPALLAATAAKVPTVIHEQNAVLGRANRFLAGDAAAIATAYSEIDRMKRRFDEKRVLVGNPVREAIAKLGEVPFPPFDDYAPFKILVTGGSQGATVLSKVVPEGLGLLSPSLRLRLQVMQQCRPDDIDQVRTRYSELGIPAELMTYIEDMPAKLAEAHLVIARSGASTVAELTAAGRPAILIPYPEATDDHQTANARDITTAGGARMIHQPFFTPEALAKQIEVMAKDPQSLINAAARALSVGKPHAASDLADLIERVGGGLSPVEVGLALSPRVRAGAPAGGVPA
jgi:UDP-N-acetylglucosamine--N-acetylmuramyl-(pentapeptide) pyrophosphoryl-undecaprenol N-acetylglucosamine transferase